MPPCKDHLGNEFPSKTAMCGRYGISPSSLCRRLSSGMSLEEALTTPLAKRRKPCEDHLGNGYPTQTAMAREWGLSSSTFQNRVGRMGLTTEQALTMDHQQAVGRKRGCTDHLGNTFPSKRAMCRHWKVRPDVFFSRIGIGWTLERALTTPVAMEPPNAKTVRDHLGDEFPSVSAMCKHWGMTRSTYNARIKNGWSVEDALTVPATEISVAPRECVDHTGRTFPTLNAMCRHWGTTKDAYKTRTEKLGWPVEKALTTPNVVYGRDVTDYEGNSFPSIRDMCHYYGFQPHDLQGTDVGEAAFLRAVSRRYRKGTSVGDVSIVRPLTFPYFLVAADGHEYVWTFGQLMDEYHAHGFWPLPESKVRDRHLEIVRCLGFPLYEVAYDGTPDIWDYWRIIRHRKETNYGLSQAKQESPRKSNKNE